MTPRPGRVAVRNADCLRSKVVLVVEDEVLVAMHHADQLRALGCVVLGPVGTVRDALAAIEHRRPDAVLLDGNLHGKLSVPVAEALRRMDVPYLVVTGYLRSLLVHPALREAPYLAKPFQSMEFVRRMVETFC
jgi:CheY-like chemotaxis protein